MITSILSMLPLLFDPAAAPKPRIFVAAAPGKAPARTGPVQARRGRKVTLYAVIARGRTYFTSARRLVVRGRRVSARRVRPLSALGRVSLRWYRVEPRQHHVKTPPPNPGIKSYSNAVLLGKRHGRWLGFDKIEYYETAIPGATGTTLERRRAHPTDPMLKPNRGLGTMRYKVVARVGGVTLASPGAEATGTRGILPQVMRVSFRESDDLVGWLTSYFNVPNVFGSAGPGRNHQTERYQGADCADVIVGAARRAGVPARLLPYTHVAALYRYAKPVTGKLILNDRGFFRKGRPVTLRHGKDVRPGDIMLIDYVGFTASPRRWDHVAVLGRDAGRKGILDAKDPVIHVGNYTLLREQARAQGPARVQFLRLKPYIRRTMRLRP